MIIVMEMVAVMAVRTSAAAGLVLGTWWGPDTMEIVELQTGLDVDVKETFKAPTLRFCGSMRTS